MYRVVVIAVLSLLSAGAALAAEPAGPFELSSGLGSNLCLRSDGPLRVGAPLIVGSCEHEHGARFHMEGRTLRIGDLCVDDAQGQGRDLDPIIAYSCHGRENQQWHFAPDGTIRGIHGKCIDVKGGEARPGTPAILFSCHGRANQQWSPRPLEPRMGVRGGPIVSRLASNLCLNVFGGLQPGATVGVWQCEHGANSQFRLEDGRIMAGDLCLASGEKNGVIAVPCDDPRVRSFVVTGDGLIRTRNGVCLDVEGGKTAPGTRALLWGCHGRMNQQWNVPPEMASAEPQPVMAPQPVPVQPVMAPQPVPVQAVEPTYASAVSAEDFAGIREAINQASFSDDKLNTLRSAAEGRSFTTAQVGALVDLFSFSGEKIKVVETLHHSLVDPQNKYQLLEHFTFSADKEKVSQLLQR